MIEFFLVVTVVGLLISIFSIYVGYRDLRAQREIERLKAGSLQAPREADLGRTDA
jgi:cell division protein FtsL